MKFYWLYMISSYTQLPLYSYFQSQGRSLLVTKIGPAGPFLVSQEWSSRTIFYQKLVRPDCFYPDHLFGDSPANQLQVLTCYKNGSQLAIIIIIILYYSLAHLHNTIRCSLVIRRDSRLTHDYSASRLITAHLYLKCGLTPLAALGSYKFYQYSIPEQFWLDQFNFGNQIWSPQTNFR